ASSLALSGIVVGVSGFQLIVIRFSWSPTALNCEMNQAPPSSESFPPSSATPMLRSADAGAAATKEAQMQAHSAVRCFIADPSIAPGRRRAAYPLRSGPDRRPAAPFPPGPG